MIVPEYWAEAKERIVVNGKAATYRRFGWSDLSQQEALDNAQERVREAAERARRGEQVRLVDHKVSYNGAEGLPIREQIVERHGDTVITRNVYGALCLNSPRVVFADIDMQPDSGWGPGSVLFGLSVVVGLGLWIVTANWWLSGLAVGVGVVLSSVLGAIVKARKPDGKEQAFETSLKIIETYFEANPDWMTRVYRTPNGFRLLVMHQTFEPDDENVYRFMTAVGSDKNYMQMCRNQKCFRARLTPKPWRIDMGRLAPRPGVWPIREERLPARNEWINQYERVSEGFASCRYEKTLGSGRSDRDCDWVREIHDDMCKANRDLPLA